MAPATAKNLEIKITAMMSMFSDVLQEIKETQKPPTKKQQSSIDMAAKIKLQMMTGKRKIKIPLTK